MLGNCISSVINSKLCLFFWKCMPWKLKNEPILPTFDHEVCVENSNSLVVGVEGKHVDLFQITTTKETCTQACAEVLCGNVSSVVTNACECAQTLLLTLSNHLSCPDKTKRGRCNLLEPRDGVFECQTKQKLQRRFCTHPPYTRSNCVHRLTPGYNDLVYTMTYYDMENDVIILSAAISFILFCMSFLFLLIYQKRHHMTWITQR